MVLPVWSEEIGCAANNRHSEFKVNPNATKISYRGVGCAHQTSLISSVKGGQSPPDICLFIKKETIPYSMLSVRCSMFDVHFFSLLCTKNNFALMEITSAAILAAH
jgi:hypothetical protein